MTKDETNKWCAETFGCIPDKIEDEGIGSMANLFRVRRLYFGKIVLEHKYHYAIIQYGNPTLKFHSEEIKNMKNDFHKQMLRKKLDIVVLE